MNLKDKHLPLWIANNRFFKFLFLFRKIYLVRNKIVHYSQFGEDTAVLNLFSKTYKGFYVDVGCYHPTRFSNTWLLYQRGWRGINIDIDQVKIDGFNLKRSEDINICKAISNTESEITYYSGGFYSLGTTLNSEVASKNPNYIERKTQASTLENIINSTIYAGRQIDLLTVDAEGHDLEVLCSLNFSIYSPKLIIVECHERNFDYVLKSNVYKFLTEKGYKLIGWCGLSLLMVSNSVSLGSPADKIA